MSQYDIKIETYPVQSEGDGQPAYAAKAHIWESTSDEAKPRAVLSEQFGQTQREAREKAEREARKWLAERTIEQET